MSAAEIATRMNTMTSSTAMESDNGQRRSFPAWPLLENQSTTSGSEGCPNGSRTLSIEAAMSVGNGKLTIGGIAATDGNTAGQLVTAAVTAGRRRANSDLDRSSSIIVGAERPLSTSSNVSVVDETDDDDQLAINARRDRDPKKSALYKTELCRSFEETGHLQRHPKYKTEICRTFWEKGTCPYGKRCCFIHNEGPGSMQLSANGSSASLVSETASDTPATVTGSVNVTASGGTGGTALASSLAALTVSGNANANDGIGSSSTTDLSTTLTMSTMAPTTATTPTVVLSSQHASPAEQATTSLFPDLMGGNTSPSLTAMRLPDAVTGNMWTQSTLLDNNDNDNDRQSNSNNNISMPSCLLSSDLLQQLDIRPDVKSPQRSRAWTIDSMNDSVRYTGTGPTDNRFGISNSNVDLSSISYNSPSLLPAATSLLPASPALSAASVHSTNGGSGPLTPPVLGPIGGGLPSASANASGALGMLPVPVMGGLSTSALRSIGGRPRSSSVGTNNNNTMGSIGSGSGGSGGNTPVASLLALQSTFHPHYQLHQPHNPSLLGTSSSTTIGASPAPIGTTAIGSTMDATVTPSPTIATANVNATVTATTTTNGDSTEQRRLPVFRRFGHS
ncbi:hypothetical protein BDF19DRAFT_420532 [Syncephalis fuscata]|nr:hypothetical protein BDF19DRAFT_420532 [Syncephalis fuscata]